MRKTTRSNGPSGGFSQLCNTAGRARPGLSSALCSRARGMTALSATLVTGPWACASPSVSAPNWSSTTRIRGLSAWRLPASASNSSSAASQARKPGSPPGRLSFRPPAGSGRISADGTVKRPVYGKAAILGQLLDRPDKTLDHRLIGQEAVGHQPQFAPGRQVGGHFPQDRKSTRLNSSHVRISYAVFCLKKKKKNRKLALQQQTTPPE